MWQVCADANILVWGWGGFDKTVFIESYNEVFYNKFWNWKQNSFGIRKLYPIWTVFVNQDEQILHLLKFALTGHSYFNESI